MDESKLKGFLERLHGSDMKLSKRFKIRLSENILKLDLGLGHFMLLKFLSASDEPPILTEMAKHLSVSPSMMTHLVDKLEQKGIVKRIRDSIDRRIIKLELSAKGKKILKQCDDDARAHALSALKQLDDRDQEQFISAMTTLIALIDKVKE